MSSTLATCFCWRSSASCLASWGGARPVAGFSSSTRASLRPARSHTRDRPKTRWRRHRSLTFALRAATRMRPRRMARWTGKSRCASMDPSQGMSRRRSASWRLRLWSCRTVRVRRGSCRVACSRPEPRSSTRTTSPSSKTAVSSSRS
ncbi:Engels-Howarth-Jen cofactor C [Saprolegnia parasitica CBS 223.65]|uniref:Engels-Howarth-Jen cofactor C n=1 Tax=Saprolegnia parasitica (strain CBS 223.65) TaxID=695850 RepID=A0A067BR69_SAPPC|nr:Engels-Howarth-Jen cofactor C [Saprolegnia parasitica CBS 223.65]KDO16806.1 Engels-Howarth-Jen cofactor C [Saprolegnia parasitica CBS 223.65]|eukprot:XP_012212486.1 Engels-Howarth-Jen cofactor C [Saprolegnia parasitica CBS 223.65]